MPQDGPSGSVLLALVAPAILCLPLDPGRRLRLLAGSSGATLSVNDMAMTTALGNRPEAFQLRRMVEGRITLSLADRPVEHADIARAMAAIEAEALRAAPGQQIIIEAQLRILLVLLWRHAFGSSEITAHEGPQTFLLRRFRQLVEAHFRDRWRVSDYAATLNITADRLHDLTTRLLNRSPRALVQERSQREARALLMRSNMTLDQIAAYLGFKSAAQFSAFFAKLQGVPPGRFRAEALDRQARNAVEPEAGFTDWP